MKKALKAIKQSWGLLNDNPLLTMPLVLFASIEGIVLYLLFLAPQEPFSRLLAPPIIDLFGEQSIRYPEHILNLPKIFHYTQLYFLNFPGILLSALFIGFIGYVRFERNTQLRYHIKTVFHRFFALLIIWLISLSTLELFEGAIIKAFSWSDSAGYFTSLKFLAFFLSFGVQIVFLYTLPPLILAEQPLIKALITNFRYLGCLFLPTLFILLMTLLCLSLFILLTDCLMKLAARTSPEIIVVSLSANIILTFTMNLFLTTTSTLLFIDEQETDPEISLVTRKEAST